MNERELKELREASWRRKLSASEEARLQQILTHQPEAQAESEADAALTHLLRQLPDPALSSNFTAQVLRAVERAAVQPVRTGFSLGTLRPWFGQFAPRLAWVAGLVAVGLLVLRQHEVAERGKVAAVTVPIIQAVAATLPDPRVLQDFDAIQQLGQLPPPTDVELLGALAQDTVSP